MKFIAEALLIIFLSPIAQAQDFYTFAQIREAEALPGQYELVLIGNKWSSDRSIRVWRQVRIPLELTVKYSKNFGASFQLWGLNETDAFIGDFKIEKSILVSDLFTDYHGRSTNAGIVVIGIGRSKAVSATGIHFSKWNGAISMIGPAGTPIGIHVGYSNLYFQFRLEPKGSEATLIEEKSSRSGSIEKTRTSIAIEQVLTSSLQPFAL